MFVCGAEPVDWIELKAVHVNQLDECQPELKPLEVLFEWIWFVSGRLVKERGIVLRNTTRAIPSVCYFISQISFVIVSADVFFFSLLRPWLMSQLTELKSENWFQSIFRKASEMPNDGGWCALLLLHQKTSGRMRWWMNIGSVGGHIGRKTSGRKSNSKTTILSGITQMELIISGTICLCPFHPSDDKTKPSTKMAPNKSEIS